MLRGIIGVVVGFIVMGMLVSAGFAVGLAVLGEDGVFKPGTFEANTKWILMTSVLGLVSAILGGWLCALIARGWTAPLVMIALIIVFGAGDAVYKSTREAQLVVRSDEVGFMEAMDRAKKAPVPLYVLVINPIIGAVGVLIGAKMRGSGHTVAKS